MKKLLFFFYLAGLGGAAQAMKPKDEVDHIVMHKKWHVLVKDIKAEEVSLANFIGYTKNELDQKGNSGDTLFENVMYAIGDSVEFNSNMVLSTTREARVLVRAMEVLILTDKITHNKKMADEIIQRKTFISNNAGLDLQTKNKCLRVYTDTVEQIVHHKTQIEQLIAPHLVTENRYADLISYLHTNKLPVEYLADLTDEQKEKLTQQIGFELKDSSSTISPVFLAGLINSLLRLQAVKKADTSLPAKSILIILGNKKFLAVAGIAFLAIGGLITYKYSASSQDEEGHEDEENQAVAKNNQGA